MVVRQTFLLFKERMLNWLFNGKQIIIFLFMLMLANYALAPIGKLSVMTGQPVQLWEPFLAAVNSVKVFPGILLGFLVLCSDFYSLDEIKTYLISRSGKKVWYAGNVLFALGSALFYAVEVAAVFSLRIVMYAYPQNGWSLLTRNYLRDYAQAGTSTGVICMVSNRIYHHFTPNKAFMTQLFLLAGLLFSLHLIIVITGLKGHLQIGILLDGILLLSGIVLSWVGHPLFRYHPLGSALLYVLNNEVLKSGIDYFEYLYLGGINLLLILWGTIKVLLWKGIEKA